MITPGLRAHAGQFSALRQKQLRPAWSRQDYFLRHQRNTPPATRSATPSSHQPPESHADSPVGTTTVAGAAGVPGAVAGGAAAVAGARSGSGRAGSMEVGDPGGAGDGSATRAVARGAAAERPGGNAEGAAAGARTGAGVAAGGA